MKLDINELTLVAREWLDAGDGVVCHWYLWEQRASGLLRAEAYIEELDHHTELMHAVMAIAVAVCEGMPIEVKEALRRAAPSALQASRTLFWHLPSFATVLDAEARFREGALAEDWSLVIDDAGGQLTVRTVYKRMKAEVKH